MDAVLLLVVGVSGAVLRPRGLPRWVVPAVAAAVAVAAGVVRDPDSVLRPLAAPIAFLLVAVPLAALLDRLGFFTAAARVLGHGDRLALGLWVLGALVTTVLNLDASVVLLTPLYVRIARRCGLDPVALAFQPVLLSCLASSALPVSNLTNLIAASSRHLDAADFLTHLGLPSLAATVVGWFAYRAVFHPGKPTTPDTEVADRAALAVGAAVVAAVLVGFVVGPGIGIPEWVVALAADVVLIGVTRSFPLGAIPWSTALLAAGLGVLAAGAAAHLPLTHLLAGSANVDLLRIIAVAAVGANLVNNLPALLIALPHTGVGIWALLLGVNLGPLVLITGTLAALLWQASLNQLDIRVSASRFARAGAQVMVPALGAAIVVFIALRPLVGA